MADIIFIYGPPAAGKLTIAKALSQETGISVFHNHLTFDVASTIYEPWTKPFYDYCEELRLDGFRRALTQNKRLIFTFCYVVHDDDAFISKVQSLFDEYGKTIQFVRLKTEQNTLLSRVSNESRTKYGKLTSKEILKDYLTTHNSCSIIVDSNTVEVDTDKLTPKESAIHILNEMGKENG